MTPAEQRLKPCPFCGECAELDVDQGYRALVGGEIGTAVAVYCTECAAYMGFCREDYPELTINELREIVVAEWNRRALDGDTGG